MFRNLHDSDKKALFVAAAVNMPIELNENPEQTWSFEVLKRLAEELHFNGEGISESYVHAYVQNPVRVDYEVLNLSTRVAKIQPFFSSIDRYVILKMYIQLLMFLVINRYYDARGRELIRNFRTTALLYTAEFVAIEVQLSKSLLAYQNSISHKTDDSKTQNAKYYRYAKIGAAAVGAGAVLALTGGLAAPAVAAAFVVMGGTSAAAAVSVVTMATVFGSAGAGLTGYKMMRRTRGLQEFEFEQVPHATQQNESQLVAMIMVSGWIEDREDYKRAFGILPDQMTLKERLVRFYSLHCPERIPCVEEDTRKYEEVDPAPLFAELRTLYGRDPCLPEDLQPQYPCPTDNSLYEAIIEFALSESVNDHPEIPQEASGSSAVGSSSDALGRRMRSFLGGGVRSEKNKHCNAGGNGGGGNGRHAKSSVRGSDAGATITEKEKLRDRDVRAFESDSRKLVFSQHLLAESHTKDIPSLNEEGPQIDAANLAKQLDKEDDAVNLQPDEAVAADLADVFRSTDYWSWRELDICPMYELYLLRWELRLQQDLGSSILDMLKSLSSAAVQNVLAYTVFAALASAVLWPVALLKLTDMIDGLWTLAVERADLAGKELAKALLQRPSGSKPVTLVGYSLGARVVFSCLKELAKQVDKSATIDGIDGDISLEQNATAPPCKNSEVSAKVDSRPLSQLSAVIAEDDGGSSDDDENGSLFDEEEQQESGREEASKPSRFFFSRRKGQETIRTQQNNNKVGELENVLNARDLQGLVQDVVLLGAPVSLNSRSWAPVRRLVNGRLINGYSPSDKVLSVVYRYSRFKVGVSGIAPVTVCAGVENVDLSAVVEKHVDYCRKMRDILRLLDLANGQGAPTVVPATAAESQA